MSLDIAKLAEQGASLGFDLASQILIPVTLHKPSEASRSFNPITDTQTDAGETSHAATALAFDEMTGEGDSKIHLRSYLIRNAQIATLCPTSDWSITAEGSRKAIHASEVDPSKTVTIIKTQAP
jgi:hypothetical protein